MNLINYLRTRELKKLQAKMSHIPFLGLSKSKNACILFTNTQPSKPTFVVHIEKMLQKNGIKYRSLGFVHQKLDRKEVALEGFIYKNQLKWNGLPKADYFEKLNHEKFDIIFEVDSELKNPNSFILLAVSAGLRVGFLGPNENFDLVVDRNIEDPKEVIRNMESYLTKIIKK